MPSNLICYWASNAVYMALIWIQTKTDFSCHLLLCIFKYKLHEQSTTELKLAQFDPSGDRSLIVGMWIYIEIRVGAQKGNAERAQNRSFVADNVESRFSSHHDHSFDHLLSWTHIKTFQTMVSKSCCTTIYFRSWNSTDWINFEWSDLDTVTP